jgi:hypothetical protein
LTSPITKLKAVAAAVLLSALLAHPSVAAETPSPQAVERTLTGSWKGNLEYRDYQTNEVYRLPMISDISVARDEVTFTRVSQFDDGPKTGTVYITSVTLFSSGTASSAAFRKDRAVDVWTDTVRVAAYVDETHWTLVYQRDAVDGEKPATIRETEIRDGARLTRIKEVRPVGPGEAPFAFRNQTVLIRQ